MPWFKVDDSIHSHPKAMACSLAALGLWSVAGSWSSNHLTGGFVPDYALPSLTRGQSELAGELVAAGLWERVKGGYRFHDWSGFQPDADEEKAKREKRREAGRKGGVASGKTRSKQRSNGEANASGSASDLVEPPSPSPSQEDSLRSSSSGPRKRGTRIPDDFAVTAEMVAWAQQNVPHVDGRRETEKFINYWQSKAGKDATKLDWVKTWKNWMLTAAERAPNRSGQETHQTDRNIAAMLGAQPTALPGGES